MSQNRQLSATLSYKVDQASIAAAANANAKIAASFADVKAAAATMSADVLRLNPALAQATAATQTLAQTQVLGAQAATSAQKTLNFQLNENLVLQRQISFEERSQAAFVNRSGGAGGNLGGSISKFSRGLFNLPDVQLTPGVSTTMISRLGLAAGGGIEAAGLGIGALAAGAAIAAPAVLLLVGAISAISSQSQAAAANAKTFANALTAAFQAGSTAQIQALIKQKQQEIAIAEANQRLLLEKAKGAQEGLAQFVDRTSADLAARLNQAATDLTGQGTGGAFDQSSVQSREALNEQAAEQAKIIEQAKIALEAYNLVFGEQIIITGDDAEAEQRLLELRQRIAEAATGIQNAELDAAVRADQLTREAREERMLQINAEIHNRAEYVASHDLEEAVLQANAVAVDKLRNEYVELASIVTSTGDLLASEKQYRDSAAKALQDLNQQMQIEAQALERIADIRQQMSDLEADTQLKSRELAQDTDQKVLDAQADAADKRLQIEQDDADRRAEILKRFNTDYFNAVADRDALAAFKAKQQRDDDLDKQTVAYKKAQEQLQKALDKQLRTIQQQFERQQTSIDDAYNKQLRGLKRDLDEQNAAAENARRNQKILQDNYNRLVEQAEIMHRAAQFKTIYDYGEMTGVYLSNLWRKIADGAGALLSINSQFNNPNAPTGTAGSGGGFPPLSDPNGNIIGGSGGGGNILTRNTASPNLGSAMSSIARSPVPLYGSGANGRSASASIQVVNNFNGSNLTARQVGDIVEHKVLSAARKAGF